MIISRECDEKYNIFNGAGLYLGSLAKYRAIENPETRDELEATFHFEINIPKPIKLSKSWCNALLNGTMRFEKDYVGIGSRMGTASEFGVVYECNWREMNIEENDPSKDYIVVSAKILFSYQVPNCLVLCMRKYNKHSVSITDDYKSM